MAKRSKVPPKSLSRLPRERVEHGAGDARRGRPDTEARGVPNNVPPAPRRRPGNAR